MNDSSRAVGMVKQHKSECHQLLCAEGDVEEEIGAPADVS